jgi:hypothetical protein
MTVPDLAELYATTRRGLDELAGADRAEYLPNAVGTAARDALGQAVTALVLGMDDAAWPVVAITRDWLADSEARDERVGSRPEYWAMLRSEALGLAAWLLDGDPGDAFATAVSRHESGLVDRDGTRPLSREDLVHLHLPDLVRDCFTAGRYRLGVEAYSRFLGPVPATSAEVDTPVRLAGWLCAEVGRFGDPADWLAVGGRVLRHPVVDWLERGRGVEAGLWLRLLFFDSGAASTPAEALRRGGQLVGALPVDPLAAVLLDSLGDPVDLDLFTGFVAAVGAAALAPGSVVTLDVAEHAPVRVEVGEPELVTGLDRAIAAALAALTSPSTGTLPDRLADAVRGRLVAADGQTPLLLRQIRVS